MLQKIELRPFYVRCTYLWDSIIINPLGQLRPCYPISGYITGVNEHNLADKINHPIFLRLRKRFLNIPSEPFNSIKPILENDDDIEDYQNILKQCLFQCSENRKKNRDCCIASFLNSRLPNNFDKRFNDNTNYYNGKELIEELANLRKKYSSSIFVDIKNIKQLVAGFSTTCNLRCPGCWKWVEKDPYSIKKATFDYLIPKILKSIL